MTANFEWKKPDNIFLPPENSFIWWDEPANRPPYRLYWRSPLPDPSNWDRSSDGLNCGHPAIARFLAKWLNLFFAWRG